MQAAMRCSLLTLGLALVASAGFAQNPGENSLLLLMPELRTMAAPDWLREGTRVTYFTASATVPAERFYWYKDQRGGWTKADEVGPAGAGYLQYVCVYRSTNGAVGTLDSYGIDINTGILIPQSLGGAVDPAGAGACWANPAALAGADRFQSPNAYIVKMPQPIGNAVYNAVRFHYVGDIAVDDTVYDLETGLLLFYQHIALSADARSTLMSQMTFTSLRQAPPPVAEAPAPDWAAATTPLQYQGALAVQVPGSPTFPLPIHATLQKTDGGARWGKYQITQQLQGQLPEYKEVFCGAGGIAGQPWMAPALLHDLQPGQVLDQDPLLGIVTTVEQVMPGPTGGELVVVSQQGKGFKRSHAYDRASGMLLMVNAMQQVGIGVQQMQLQLVR